MCLLDINEIGSTHLIVCTNGYPNYGVGGINDDNIEEMKLYYNKLSQTLTSRRVSMDIYASGGNTIQVPVLYVYIYNNIFVSSFFVSSFFCLFFFVLILFYIYLFINRI